jgi:hypothetical protein
MARGGFEYHIKNSFKDKDTRHKGKRDNPNRHYKPSLVHFNAILLNKSSSKVYDYY